METLVKELPLEKESLHCKILFTSISEMVTLILPATGEYSILVLDNKGRQQKHESIHSYTMMHNIYLSKFPPGDYTIRVTELSSMKQVEYWVRKE